MSIVVLLAACAVDVAPYPERSAAAPTGAKVEGRGMVFLAAGGFLMGCDPGEDARCGPDEAPVRLVTLGAFLIDAVEVTRGAYKQCVASGACGALRADLDARGAEDLPVRGVTWTEATTFCAALDRRLPTEAEWERAARGSTPSNYPWGDDPPSCERANYEDCGGRPDVVSARADGMSRDGVLDLAGNVAEWTADWYAPGYEGDASVKDPTGPEAGTLRAVRGGDFSRGEHALRGSARLGASPGKSYAGIGIRCAASAR